MISVIIPVKNSKRELERCLTALGQSRFTDYECIVADDGSTDGSAEAATRYGCRVIRRSESGGPGAARNTGAREARGDILFFIDADVCVHPDSLSRVAEDFAEDPSLDALIGSYDENPDSPDFLSQYKNLMHCFVHQTGNEAASTFWGGCGAIRRAVFEQYSGFNEGYGRPSIEDIELGYRLSADGRRILLDKNLQVQHLKAWSFWRLLKTDIFDRGIPWTELILRDANMPNDLNVQISQRISVALVYLMLAAVGAMAVQFKGLFLVPLLLLLVLLLSGYWFHNWHTEQSRGRLLLGIGALFAASIYFAWRHHMLSLIPPLAVTLALIYLQHRFLRGSRGWRVYSLLTGICLGGTAIFILSFMPYHPMVIAPFVFLILVLFINSQFYVFLRGRKSFLFALAAIPFHLLYHFYNGISFCAGMILYWTRRKPSHLPAKPAQRPADPVK
ncbi:MAG TPA: glycosyltransferase family 2 protein [Bryobacterales bacterium]|nr:glycosyltransferase family 2 protein [Bryobacterales bacterium]